MGQSILRSARTAVAALCLLSLGACSELPPLQQEILSGAAIGTVVGAAGTVMMGGCVACGAAVGGVVGAGTGYLVDKVKVNWGDDSGSSSMAAGAPAPYAGTSANAVPVAPPSSLPPGGYK